MRQLERTRSSIDFALKAAAEGSMARPVVDQDLCVGCRLCETACPQVFAVNSDEKAVVVGPDNCRTCDCQQAIDTCPARAISWSE